jgi:hypothetical protein
MFPKIKFDKWLDNCKAVCESPMTRLLKCKQISLNKINFVHFKKIQSYLKLAKNVHLYEYKLSLILKESSIIFEIKFLEIFLNYLLYQ